MVRNKVDAPPIFQDEDMGLDLEDTNTINNNKNKKPNKVKGKERQISEPISEKVSLKEKEIVDFQPRENGRRVSDSNTPKTLKKSESQKDTTLPSLYSPPSTSPQHFTDNKISSSNIYEQQLQNLEQNNMELLNMLDDKDKTLNFRWEQEFIAPLIHKIESLPESALHAKIVEVVKKNKSLTVQIEKERTKYAKLATQLSVNMSSPTTPSTASSTTLPSTPTLTIQTSPEELLGQLKALKSRMTRISQENSERKMENDKLQSSIKMYQQALNREIGDEVDIEKLLSSDSNWRGRAEQIAFLKNKVKDSQRVSSFSTNTGEFAQLARPAIETRAGQRMKEIEHLQTELDTMKEDISEYKFRTERLNVKNGFLKAEVETWKDKVRKVLDKSESDDKLIELLKREINRLQDVIVKNGLKNKAKMSSEGVNINDINNYNNNNNVSNNNNNNNLNDSNGSLQNRGVIIITESPSQDSTEKGSLTAPQ